MKKIINENKTNIKNTKLSITHIKLKKKQDKIMEYTNTKIYISKQNSYEYDAFYSIHRDELKMSALLT